MNSVMIHPLRCSSPEWYNTVCNEVILTWATAMMIVDSTAGIKRSRNVPIEFCTGHCNSLGSTLNSLEPLESLQRVDHSGILQWVDQREGNDSLDWVGEVITNIANHLNESVATPPWPYETHWNDLAAEKQLGDFFIIWKHQIESRPVESSLERWSLQ